MIVKPQDVFVLLKLFTLEDLPWSYAMLASALKMSASEVHAGIKRAEAAKLYNPHTKKPTTKALEEFLIHGVKYAYPPEKGGQTRGVVTSYAAFPLNRLIQPGNEPPPVWPYAQGTEFGYEFTPLFKSVPEASQEDPKLYALLTLVDAIRDGRAREKAIAIAELKKRLHS